MIKIENLSVSGWEMAIYGMRNPLNSWNKMDSKFYTVDTAAVEDRYLIGEFILGHNDLDLACRLIKAGQEHRKFLRMIHVQMNITAPQFWWAEHDTYKVATTRNSCSKMHRIHVRPFELEDFTHEGCDEVDIAKDALINTITTCEELRLRFNATQDKKYWRALIELLPEGYNIMATWDGSLATILDMIHQRKNHKLDEWHTFYDYCLDNIPYCREFYSAMTEEAQSNA